MSVVQRRLGGLSLGALVSALWLGVWGAPAGEALPPTGAGVNTPGTNSTVAPQVLKAGDTIGFDLTGFPRNEQVYIKIDNGQACPADSPQGACVVHQQKSDGTGRVEGSLVLPRDLSEGTHTLRFLATALLPDGKGTKGYTNESPGFTVQGVNESSVGGRVYSVDAKDIAAGAGGSSGAGTPANRTDREGSGRLGESSGNGSPADAEGASGRDGAQGDSRGQDQAVEYLDEAGRPISAEEYARRQAEGSGSSSVTVSPSASATAASPSGTRGAEKSTAAEVSAPTAQAASTEHRDREAGAFPWAGTIVLVLAVAVAAAMWMRRRSPSTADPSAPVDGGE